MRRLSTSSGDRVIRWRSRGRRGDGRRVDPTCDGAGDDGRPRSRLQAVLFDMDGLLIDSEPLWTAVETEFAARHGTVWSSAIKQAIVGTRLDASVPTMLRMFGTPSAAAADPRVETAWVTERIVGLFRRGVVLKPGAAELLAAVSAARV